MIVFPAPFSQVSGHLLPFQADELNPSPVDQGLGSTLSRAEVACAPRRPRHPLEGGEVMETFRNTGAPDLTIRHVAQAVDLYERAFGAEEIDLLRLGGPL